MRRQIDIAVISDVHLGTYGCQASDVVNYLKTIDPKTLILNGDIIDIWQFNKKYWPKEHMQVLKEIMKIISKGTTVYYVTGNHDESLRKYSPFSLGNFHIVDKLDLTIDGNKMWFIHGDAFDLSMNYAKWIAKLGGTAYDFLIFANTLVNKALNHFDMRKMSLAHRIKSSVKSAIKYISKFEETVAEIAIENGYTHVICGHIHQPKIQTIRISSGSIEYLNSGDWVENMTALEYYNNQWQLFKHEL